MTLGRKMHDGAWLMLLDQSAQQFAVAHVSLDKAILRIGSDPKQVARIARVGQLVEVDHRSSFLLDPLQDEVGTDESRLLRSPESFFPYEQVSAGIES